MSSNRLYHLGAFPCTYCHAFTVHRLNVEHPFVGSGPVTPFNIWMDLIKKSRVVCASCGKETMPTEETKILLEELTEANLVTLEQENDFRKHFKEIMKQSHIIEDYSEEKKEEIINKIEFEYWGFGIPRGWFEDYSNISMTI